ncbi:Nucleoside recognition [Enterovibrio nigricans DSM 22720]|uniref:Nucleoside recognition n=1 Tax=Enterovibrio nigricans DSM 22720 TaxID=1121868 RepID=A0A1T4WA32_9GAMM|nr:Nucleoside recognition [Enterovibrio nigricans DSM 22720]
MLSKASQIVTPIFAPIGVQEENWQATVGIITGLFAKEAVIGTLNSLYSTAETGEEGGEYDLMASLKEAVMTIPDNLAGMSYGDPMGLNVGDLTDKATVADDQGVDTTIFGNLESYFVTGSAAFAYLLFVLLYTPCAAALGAYAREFGHTFMYFVAGWTFAMGYKDFNYEDSTLYVFTDVKDTMFDPDHFKKVAQTLTTETEFMVSYSVEESKKAIEQLNAMKVGIESLALTSEEKTTYLAAIEKATQTHNQFIEFYTSLYDTKLDQYAAEKYPEIIKGIKDAETQLAQYKEAVSPSKLKLENANEHVTKSVENFRAKYAILEAEAKQFVIDNEIVLPLKEVRFFTSYRESAPQKDGSCKKIEGSKYADYGVYLESTKQCHYVKTVNSTDDMYRFSESQVTAYEAILTKHQKTMNDVARKLSEARELVSIAKRELKKSELLAANKYGGTEYQLNSTVYNAHNRLDRQTNGAYEARHKEWEPVKDNIISRAQSKLSDIIGELKEKDGLPQFSFEKEYHVFSARNALPALEGLARKDLEKATKFTDIDDEGNLNTDGLITDDTFQIVVLDTEESKYVARLTNYLNKDEIQMLSSRESFDGTADLITVATEIAHDNYYRDILDIKEAIAEKY